ncbi:MAG: IgGFc-binding protein [Myxococcota bacterium]
MVLTIALSLAACSVESGVTPIPDLGRGGGGDTAPPNPDVDDGDPFEGLDRGDGDARTAGTELWLAFMENLTLSSNGPPVFRVLLRSEQDTSGEIRAPATGFAQPFSLRAGEAVEVALPDATLYPQGSDVTGQTGLQIIADAPIEATALHYRVYFTETSIALPVEELGSEYRVIAVPDDDGEHPGAFVVLATADSTEVQITPTAITGGLRPAGEPYTVTLNAGETYQVQAKDDLTGSRVRALNGEPIAVFSGAQQADVACPSGSDSHVYDQNYPLTRWGRRYVVVPFAQKAFDRVRVLAAVDGTEVRVDCGEPVSLGAGDFIELEVAAVTEITASAPVAVAQISRGGWCDQRQVDTYEVDEEGNRYGPFPLDIVIGDPSMVIHPPAALTRQRADTRALPGEVYTLQEYPMHFVNAWLPAGSTLQLDGEDVTAQLTALADGSRAGALEILPGNHRLESDGPFQAHAYGFDQYEAYTYHLGYDCVGCVEALTDAPACD